MRLPESMTKIAPVGEVLRAAEVGETLLADETERGNERLFVAGSDEAGLSAWEKEYGLADWTGESADRRRARLRGARAGGRTLTRKRLQELATNVGFADEGAVTEDFAAYQVALEAVGVGKFPTETEIDALSDAIGQQKPAHLNVTLVPCAELRSARNEALHGGVQRFVYADAPV